MVTLLDQLKMAGHYGGYILVSALLLWLLGMIFIFKGPSLPVRRAYLLGCFLPMTLGVLGFVTGASTAFAVLGASGSSEFFAALGEISLAPSFGFIATGVALILAGFVWLRAERPPA